MILILEKYSSFNQKKLVSTVKTIATTSKICYLLSLFFSVVASVPPSLQIIPDLLDEISQMLELQNVQLLHFELKLKEID
jgi:hypothetical protein